MDNMGMDDDNQDDANAQSNWLEIAQITFACDNAQTIKLLEKRGQFIKTEKWAELDILNSEISEQIKD